MKTQLSDKVRYGVAAVCALLLLIAWQVSVRTRLTLASASFESLSTYGVKQGPPGNRGPWRYDVNTVETQRGTIVSIERVSTEVNVGGIHLTLDIGDEQKLTGLPIIGLHALLVRIRQLSPFGRIPDFKDWRQMG